MNIRLVIADSWPIYIYLGKNGDLENGFEDDEQITQYVSDNCNDTDKLTDSGLIVENFNVPDNIDTQLLLDICTGKQFHVCWDGRVDFYTDYYHSWIFIDKDGQYVPFNHTPNKINN